MSKRTRYLSQAAWEKRADRSFLIVLVILLLCMILLPSLASAIWRIPKMLLMAAAMLVALYHAASLYCMATGMTKRKEHKNDE